ncbi:MAG TPA: PEP-CTERM sorting domain-containing protein [Tepidisphaeraceae bacterium]|nr:PEP-CTERM sorting domain-containing protein [Tepidisphaeraceae bacterium]
MDRRLVLAALAVPFVSTAALAVDPVLVDNFANGIVTDTDTIPGYWIPRLSGGISTANEAGGTMQLTAGGSQFPHGQIAGPVDSNINFFRAPVVVEGSGLNFTSPTNSLNKGIFRMSLISRALFDAAPTPPAPAAGIDDSEYWADDAFALRIESGGSTPGQYSVAMGIKENYPMHNTEYDGFQLFNPGNNSGATLPGPVRSFRLTYGAKFWDLRLTHDTSPTNSTPVTVQFTGAVDQFLLNWKDPTDAGALTGNSSVVLQTQLNNSAATEEATASLNSFTVGQLRQGWQGASGGIWSDPANWSDGDIFHVNGDNTISSVPNFVGANVKFTNAAAPTAVTMDADQTVGAILFDSAQPYTISPDGLGQGTFQMATRYLFNEVTSLQGNHTINSPINLYNDLVASAAAGANVSMTGQVVDLSPIGTLGLTKTGLGSVGMLNLRLFNVTINEGTLRVLPGPTNNSPDSASSVFNLAIAGTPSAPEGRLDLTNNALVLDYSGPSNINEVRQLLQAGASGGNGIGSSSANALFRLGYAEGSLLGGSFAGQFLDGSTVVIALLVAGDANFSGGVNLDDFTALAASFGSNGAVWTNGDFNYDGSVNLDDFTILAANFGQSGGDIARGAVPEPASLGLIAGAIAALAGRRRRA